MKKLFLLLFCSSTMLSASAQDIIYYEGQGRSEIDSDTFGGDFIDNDSTSTRRDLNGRFLFDLGINIEPNKDFRATTLLRFNNAFGGFYSEGSSLEFRQILLQGVLADKFNYQIGDMDLQLTPYTLFNNDEIYNEFESDIFALRRDVMNYENFNVDNNWRMQGIQTNTTLKFDKTVDKIDINVFGTRVRESDIATTPDRLFMGGNVNITQSKAFELGLNAANMFDVVGTSNDTATTYVNSVYTAKFKVNHTLGNIDLSLLGELGTSKLNLENVEAKIDSTQNGGFYDIGILADLKDFNTTIKVSYRMVNDEFNSPGAQSRRIYSGPQHAFLATPNIFANGLNGLATRNQTLFDRISDQGFYNQSLSPTLMNYNPAYNNVTPYGQATPNRQGVTIDIEHGNKDSLLFAHLTTDILSETIGEGMVEKRNFTSIKGGFLLNINQLIGSKKLLALNSGFKIEKTTRDAGFTSINLSSTLLDLGLAIETFDKLDLLIGLKSLTANGNEYYNTRISDFNDISSIDLIEMDFTETMTGLGLRYRFSDKSFFTINADIISYKENMSDVYADRDYKINQYYFNYTVRF